MEPRKPRKSEPNLDGDVHWGLDPQDVRRHARRMRQAQVVGPMGKLVRVVAVVLVGAGAFLLTWNFTTLKQARLDFSELTALFARDSTPAGARPGEEPGTEVIGDSSIAGGVSLPTSIKTGEPEANPPAAEPPTSEPAAPSPAPAPAPAQTETVRPSEPAPPAVAAAQEEAARPAPPPREPEPERPVKPETIGFGLEVMNVSESDASAAILVLRDGGRRQLSSFTWWVTGSEAIMGADFARLDRRVERFGVGEQNRTIYVPLVGDRAVEGPENFFVHIAAGESMTAPETAKIEVIIKDDD
ncbi:MAG TPA: Calx-beta domain-containing protein [Gammaproteobacteria bacterium]|nr:Calx-beta domain-containing protein [Gammaproteobacteria bacterium]